MFFLTWLLENGWKKIVTTAAQRANAAVTRIRTWVTSATTKGTNHYTITAIRNYEIMGEYSLFTLHISMTGDFIHSAKNICW